MPIEVKNISHTYQVGTPYEKIALNNISFNIRDNSVVGITGTTGSGKTTLLQLMAGLLIPQKGQVIIDNKEITKTKKLQATPDVGLVFQFPEMQFVADNVYDEIAYGLTYLNLEKTTIYSQVKNSLELVGLPFTTYKDKRLSELSSGEKRRVAIATILALDTKYILLDEPTAGLDYLGRLSLQKVILQLKASDKTAVIVSHSLSYLLAMCDEIFIISNGLIDMILTKDSSLTDYTKLYEANYKLPAYLETVFKLNEKGFNIRFNNVNEDIVLENIIKALG